MRCVSKVKMHSCLLSDIYLCLFYDFPGFENISCFVFFSVHERAVSSESCNLIGSGSGQNFPISDHGHGNRAKTIEWKLKNNIPRLSSGFFSLMAQRCEFFVNSQFLRVLQMDTFKRRVLVLILCSLAWFKFTLHRSFSF